MLMSPEKNKQTPISPFAKIIQFLDESGVEYKLLEHQPVNSSQEEAEITGTKLSQGAKALVLFGDGHPLMVVLSAENKIDFKKVKQSKRIKDLRMATPEQVREITGTEVGAVSPLGNLFDLPLYVDKKLMQEEEIVFGTGLYTKSILMKSTDYCKIASPTIGDFSK